MSVGCLVFAQGTEDPAGVTCTIVQEAELMICLEAMHAVVTYNVHGPAFLQENYLHNSE